MQSLLLRNMLYLQAYQECNHNIYLLDYERTADHIFDYEADVYHNDKINLSIQSKDIAIEESEDGNMAAFVVNSTLYYYDDVENDFDEFMDGVCRDTRRKRKIEYYNIPCSFDIETSSFMEGGQKRGIMYAWAFSICGFTIFGRTWDQYYDMLADIQRILQLSEDRRLVVYVHNLAWEFQFLRHREHWINVFAIELRRPIYAVSDIGIEYRCSYILTGYSLATVAETLTHFKIKKLVGDTTPEDFEIMKEKVQKAADNSIKKKERVIDYILSNNK